MTFWTNYELTREICDGAPVFQWESVTGVTQGSDFANGSFCIPFENFNWGTDEYSDDYLDCDSPEPEYAEPYIFVFGMAGGPSFGPPQNPFDIEVVFGVTGATSVSVGTPDIILSEGNTVTVSAAPVSGQPTFVKVTFACSDVSCWWLAERQVKVPVTVNGQVVDVFIAFVIAVECA